MNTKNCQKILITGGAGYLGSALSRLLLNRGHYVRVLDQLLFGAEPINDLLNNDRFHLVKGDICQVEDVTAAMVDIGAVVDLAAIVGAPACDKNEQLTIDTNYLATKLLAQAAINQGIRRFLFASTCSVYGANEGKTLTEESPTNPLSLYAETKLKSEQALMGNDNDLEPIILRLATLCGPSNRMRFDLVLNIMTATAYTEGEVRVYGGKQWRPLLDVRDAARAFCSFLETPDDVSHSIWNVGSESQNITIRELGELVSNQVEGSKLINIPGQEDPRSYNVDFSKIKNQFEPIVSMENSVQGVLKLFEEGSIEDYKSPRYYNSKLDYLT